MKTSFIFIPLFLWIISFILVILLTLELAKLLVSKGKSTAGSRFCAVHLFHLYILLFLLPENLMYFFRLSFFLLTDFHYNNIIPSLGHLLLLSILAAAFSNVFYRHFPLKELKSRNSRQ